MWFTAVELILGGNESARPRVLRLNALPKNEPFFHSFTFYFRCTMDGTDTVRRNKTQLESILCADYGLILNKVDERRLITRREYNNLKNINGVDTWGHVVELVDKILNKGNDTCRAFLDLLDTDEDIKSTYPQLGKLQWNPIPLSKPVQACSVDYCGR